MTYLSNISHEYVKYIERNKSKSINISIDAIRKILLNEIPEQSKLSLDNLVSLNNSQIIHKLIPFGTITGRTTTRGPSITGIKKCFWSEILSPPDGYIYALYDYCQQEPAIAAIFSGADGLFKQYQKNDLYEFIGYELKHHELSRSDLKRLILPYLYGQRSDSYSMENDINIDLATQLYSDLDNIFADVNNWLNQRCQQAFHDGVVKSLDWQMSVPQTINPLTIRNWPIQAAGADIMRRACIYLSQDGFDLRLTNHDSFLMKIKKDAFERENLKIIDVLKKSSAIVLGGNHLNVKLEAVFGD